jgi:DNA-binding transcriptional LysR family regulator
MNLKRFECFVAVAEELHFGRAATRLNMSQPPLSLQIKALERELGVKLFHRTSKSVRLTPAGDALLPEARGTLESSARAFETVRRARTGEAGRLTLGFVNPAMDGFLSRVVKSFKQERPHLELELREMTSTQQLAAIKAGNIHAGFIRHGWLDCSGLETLVVRRESYVLALPDDHCLNGQASIPIERLTDIPLILYPRSAQPRLYDAMIASFQKAGVTPRIVQEALSKHTALSLVSAGLGCALVPESVMAWRRDGVTFSRVAGELPTVEIAAVWPQKPHPAVKWMVEITRIIQQRTGAP